ncbi:MAG: hypothetical protein ACRDJC_06280 [Thermomicrobiales bacterium]
MPAMNDHANATHRDQQRVLDALDRELQDPGTWDWENPVELTAAPNRTLTLTVRLGRDDARLLGLGAENAGMNLSEYLVWAAKLVTHIRFQLD